MYECYSVGASVYEWTCGDYADWYWETETDDAVATLRVG